MAKCDICGKESTSIMKQVFSAESGIDPIDLCRTCQGRLILSLPKKTTPEQIKQAINTLYEKVESEKQHRHKRW